MNKPTKKRNFAVKNICASPILIVESTDKILLEEAREFGNLMADGVSENGYYLFVSGLYDYHEAYDYLKSLEGK